MSQVSEVSAVSTAGLQRSERVQGLQKQLRIEAQRTDSETITLNHLAFTLLIQGGFGESLLKGILSADSQIPQNFRASLGLKDSGRKLTSKPQNSELVNRVLEGAEIVAKELNKDSVGTGEVLISLVKIAQKEDTLETQKLRTIFSSVNPSDLMKTFQDRTNHWRNR